MNLYTLMALRLVHIVAGILWGGAAVAYLFFVKPSVKSIGLAGPQFMQHLMDRRKYPVFMISTSLLTAVAGGILFWFTSGRLNPAWFSTGPGVGFSIGSLAALIALLVGTFGVGPISGQMASLGGKIASAGTGATLEQSQKMISLDRKLSLVEWIDFIMLAISMLTMATARFWNF